MKINWKFKKDAKVASSDFWYDLTDGGYIDPDKLLSDTEQIKELKNAIAIIESFEKVLHDNDIIEEM